MKKMLCMILALALATVLIGCGNFKLIDTVYKFDYAIIALPNGNVIEGEVESWRDFEGGDMIQIKIDGVTYLTHSSKVILEAR